MFSVHIGLPVLMRNLSVQTCMVSKWGKKHNQKCLHCKFKQTYHPVFGGLRGKYNNKSVSSMSLRGTHSSRRPAGVGGISRLCLRKINLLCEHLLTQWTWAHNQQHHQSAREGEEGVKEWGREVWKGVAVSIMHLDNLAQTAGESSQSIYLRAWGVTVINSRDRSGPELFSYASTSVKKRCSQFF